MLSFWRHYGFCLPVPELIIVDTTQNMTLHLLLYYATQLVTRSEPIVALRVR